MKQQIYVALLGEGIEVWRPVDALHEKDDVYTIISENESAGDEAWQFVTGDTVSCQTMVFSDGKSALVAVAKIE